MKTVSNLNEKKKMTKIKAVGEFTSLKSCYSTGSLGKQDVHDQNNSIWNDLEQKYSFIHLEQKYFLL